MQMNFRSCKVLHLFNFLPGKHQYTLPSPCSTLHSRHFISSKHCLHSRLLMTSLAHMTRFSMNMIRSLGEIMAIIELELLSDVTNCYVVQIPERKFPGIILQGDTLRTLLAGVDEIRELCPKETAPAELIAAVASLRNQL